MPAGFEDLERLTRPLGLLVVIGDRKTERCDQSGQPLQNEEQLLQSEEADDDEDKDRVVVDRCHNKVSAIHGVSRADQKKRSSLGGLMVLQPLSDPLPARSRSGSGVFRECHVPSYWFAEGGRCIWKGVEVVEPSGSRGGAGWRGGTAAGRLDS